MRPARLSEIIMPEPLSLTEILNLLFKYRTKSDGSPYKAIEVARATGVSPAQISLLLSGQRPNTSFEIARALLRFFAVPLDVLNATSEQEVIALVAQPPRPTEPILHLRGSLSQDLSPTALAQIEQLIEYVLRREYALRHDETLPPPPDFNTKPNS
jgi:transcriptional regulator with XRE-family HTH domain